MAKRLTDSGKWDDPWFTELPNEYKLLWVYLLDKCDHAGFWKVNKRLAEFILNEKYDWEDVMVKFKHRIVSISPELWHLPKFIEFQYGQLSPNNRAHVSVIDRLSKYKLDDIKELASPLQGDKDKEQEKEKDKEKGGSRGKPTIEEAKALFREKGFPAEAEKFFDYYEANGWRVGKNPMKSWTAAAANWLRNGKSFGSLQTATVKKEKKKNPSCTACDKDGFLEPGRKCWCWQ